MKPYKEPPGYLKCHPYFQSLYGPDGSALIDTPEFPRSDTEQEAAMPFYINGADTSVDSEGSVATEVVPSTLSPSSLNDSSGEGVSPERKRTRRVNIFSRVGNTERNLLNSWLFHRGLSTVRPGTLGASVGPPASREASGMLGRPTMSSTPIGDLDNVKLPVGRNHVHDLTVTMAASLDDYQSGGDLDTRAATQKSPDSSVESLRLHLSSSLVHTDGQEHRVYTHLDTVPESAEQTLTQICGEKASTTQRILKMDSPRETVVRLGNQKIRLIDPPKPERSPVHTRSRGNVPVLPNVQQRTLEYVRY